MLRGTSFKFIAAINSASHRHSIASHACSLISFAAQDALATLSLNPILPLGPQGQIVSVQRKFMLRFVLNARDENMNFEPSRTEPNRAAPIFIVAAAFVQTNTQTIRRACNALAFRSIHCGMFVSLVSRYGVGLPFVSIAIHEHEKTSVRKIEIRARS